MTENTILLETYHVVMAGGGLCGALWMIWRMFTTLRTPVTNLEKKVADLEVKMVGTIRDNTDLKEKMSEYKESQSAIKNDIREIFRVMSEIRVSIASIETTGCSPIKKSA